MTTGLEALIIVFSMILLILLLHCSFRFIKGQFQLAEGQQRCSQRIAAVFGRICPRRRRRRRGGGGGPREIHETNTLQNIFQGFNSLFRRGPRVDLGADLAGKQRVGENLSFKIYIPISMRVGVNLDEIGAKLIEASHVQIMPMVHDVEDFQIAHIKEVQLVEDMEEEEAQEDVIHVRFSIKIAGVYGIFVSFQGTALRVGNSFGSNIIEFFPGAMDPAKTMLIRNSPALLAIVDTQFRVLIEPKDRFGNLCTGDDVAIDAFSFQLFDADESNRVGLDTISYKFSPLSFTVPGSKRANFKILLEFSTFLPGIFHGVVEFKNTGIGNGKFDLISITPDEQMILSNNLNGNPGSIYHEAKLLVYGGVEQKKLRSIYIYLAPKSLTIKEYVILGLIPRRLSIFRVLPSTKIKHLFLDVERKMSTIEVTERGSSTNVVLELDETSCRVLIAMFNHYLEARLGGTESFDNKKAFFYQELKASQESDLRNNYSGAINIRRDALVDSTLYETKYFGGSDWCSKFKIHFVNEEGVDEGGLRKEWLDLLCIKMFENSPDGMFCSLTNSRLVLPNLGRDEKTWTLKHYELAGKVAGKCMFESAHGDYYTQMVNARFGRSFLAQIIGFSPNYLHFKQDDPELFLTKVKYIMESEDIESLELTFTEEEYDKKGKLVKTVELMPKGSGIKVTKENREEYLNCLAEYRLKTRMKKEINAFLKGFHEIIPEGSLASFDENEVEILMCGKSEFSLNDLKDNHVLTTGERSMMKLLAWFWNSVENMTEEERTRLLQFTTGSSLLPQNGFKDLVPKFRISPQNLPNRLPLAHSCFNEICLSDHTNYEDFDRSLKIAINEGSEGYAFM